jgi:hypothetical protein
MSEADRLRHEATRALRLSREIGDLKAREALAKHAADLLEQAEALERENMGPAPQPPATSEQPAQQQQQIQHKKANDLVECWAERLWCLAMAEEFDIYDGEPWTEMDVEDLTAALQSGDTIEEAAQFLCRSGTVDEVRRKVEELGLLARSD